MRGKSEQLHFSIKGQEGGGGGQTGGFRAQNSPPQGDGLAGGAEELHLLRGNTALRADDDAKGTRIGMRAGVGPGPDAAAFLPRMLR